MTNKEWILSELKKEHPMDAVVALFDCPYKMCDDCPYHTELSFDEFGHCEEPDGHNCVSCIRDWLDREVSE